MVSQKGIAIAIKSDKYMQAEHMGT